MTGQASRDDLTTLLGRWRTGTPADRERLFAAVHGELRRTAGAYMRGERQEHTLQPTALVNEAYLRLIKVQDVRWEDRGHFFGIAARAMRQILVDHARKRAADKRKTLNPRRECASTKQAGLLGERWMREPSNGPSAARRAVQPAPMSYERRAPPTPRCDAAVA